jgi:hypothetical protein
MYVCVLLKAQILSAHIWPILMSNILPSIPKKYLSFGEGSSHCAAEMYINCARNIGALKGLCIRDITNSCYEVRIAKCIIIIIIIIIITAIELSLGGSSPCTSTYLLHEQSPS